MKRLLAMILALLLAVPLPVYAGSTPSDAEYADVSKAVGPDFNNTVNYSMLSGIFWYYNTADQHKGLTVKFDRDGYFSIPKPADFAALDRFEVYIDSSSRPRTGTYSVKASISMNTGVTWIPQFYVLSNYKPENASQIQSGLHYKNWPITDVIHTGKTVTTYYEQSGVGTMIINSAGDSYFEIGSILINNYKDSAFSISFYPTAVSWTMGGKLKIAFGPINKNPSYSSLGNPPSASDQLNDITDAVNQIPDKIGDVADAVQDVVQGIANLPQNIAGALEPHYDNILQQLHHITEQLHALWDQLAAYFNDKLIPQMITDTNRIVEAIESINLEVNVDFNALKQQLAQQHKEQLDNDNKNTEEIVNGYENGDMDSISGQFGDAATNSDNAEDQLINSVSGNISDFTFDPDIMFEYIEAIDDVAQIMSYFLRLSIIKTPLVFMLTLSIALLMIGYYRFKGGG